MSYISHVTYTRVRQRLSSLVSGNFLWVSHGGSSSACTERVLHLLSSPREGPHHLPNHVSQKPGATYFTFSPHMCRTNQFWFLHASCQSLPAPVSSHKHLIPELLQGLLTNLHQSTLDTAPSPIPPPMFYGGHPPCSKPKMNVPTWGECQKHLPAQPTALILRAGRMKVEAG